MGKVFTEFERFQHDKRRAQRKAEIMNGINAGLAWVGQNKEALLLVSPVVLGIGGLLKRSVRGINRRHTLKMEKDLKDLYIYDRSMGHQVRLKRPLTNSEYLHIAEERRKGKRLYEILRDLRVLA